MQLSILFCVLISAFAFSHLASALDYSDIEAMGINCPERVSCIAIIRGNFTDRNCECDRDCSIYSDCCIDARTRLSSRNSRRSNPPSCMQFGDDPNLGAYVTATCRRDFTGSPELQSKCQNQNNLSDPLMAAPVTDINAKVTYRNRYCAECNNANVASLRSWSIKMGCDFNVTVNNSFIWEHLTYRPDINKWGVWFQNDFQSCVLMFDKPSFLENSVRMCRAGMISTCASNWNRHAVTRACQAYTAVIHAGSTTYRNPHCALCNHVTVDSMICTNLIHSRKKKPFSFALLLDVNQSDGDLVGVSRPGGVVCGPNQKYDPYFKKCRNLVCALPGYVMVNGKCQRP